MSYLIVEASDASTLEERVQRKQQEGWEPVGGVSAAPKSWRDDGSGTKRAIDWRYSQAMQRIYFGTADFAPDGEALALLREGYETVSDSVTVAGIEEWE